MTVTLPTAHQLRAARAALGWTLEDLHQRCHLSRNSLSLYERGQGNPTVSTLLAIKHVFEAAGLRFVVVQVEGEQMAGVAWKDE